MSEQRYLELGDDSGRQRRARRREFRTNVAPSSTPGGAGIMKPSGARADPRLSKYSANMRYA
eukprot:5424963-Prymnesium_polylepis.1